MKTKPSKKIQNSRVEKMNLVYFTDDRDITKKTGLTHDEIWDTGVCLDDWDYGYIVKGVMTEKIKRELKADELLRGVCYNEWYIIQDKKGNYWTIGMAYHS